MKKYFTILLIAIIAVVTGCDKAEPENPAPQPEPEKQETVTLASGTDTAPVVATEGGTVSVTFTSSAAWTADVINTRSSDWCSVSPTSGGAGTSSITITVKENTTPDNRAASVTIKSGTASQTIKVEQKQKDALTVTASSFEVPFQGGEIKVTTKSNVAFTHTISANAADWIKVVSTKAMKDSTLTFAISANENKEKREGEIYISSGGLKDTVKVYQAGESPTIVVSQDEYVLKSEGESFEVEIASNVNATMDIVLPDGIQAWISENATKAISTNRYSFTASPNEMYDSRSAMIVFSNKENNLADTVRVVQMQKDAIVLAKSVYEFDKQGGTLDFDIQTNVDVAVTISDQARAWITQVETRGLETKKLYFNIASCDTLSASRSGEITLSGGNAVQTIRVVQKNDVEIDPSQMPDNEIWYVSDDGKIMDLKDNGNATGLNANVVSHEYKNGIGIIRFDADLTRWHNLVDRPLFNEGYGKNWLKSICIPGSIVSFDGGNPFLDSRYLESFKGELATEDGRGLVIGEKFVAVAPDELTESIVPQGVKTIVSYAYGPAETVKKITIPDGVHTLRDYCFSSSYNIQSLLEEVVLPSSIETVGGYMFLNNDRIKRFSGDCKFISDDGYSFVTYNNLTNVHYLVKFAAGAGLTSYTIPESVEGIEANAFNGASALESLTFPDSIKDVRGDALRGAENLQYIYGKNVLEDNKSFVYEKTLMYVAPKGLVEYTTPECVEVLGANVFNNKPELESVIISDNVKSVDGYGYIFMESHKLKSVTVSARMTSMGYDPFGSASHNFCQSLQSVYFRSPVPPMMSFNFPDNVESIYKDVKIYVPSESEDLYKHAVGTKLLAKYIEPYNYGDLSEFYPDYYFTRDYSADGTVHQLQKATQGKGIDIVLMADAYSDRQIADGTYKKNIEFMYNALFMEEPYKSFKHLFNVHYVDVVSPFEGYGNGAGTLGGFFGVGTYCGGNDDTVFEYALKAVDKERMNETMVIVALNSDYYSGTCYMFFPESGTDYGSGASISYFGRGGNETAFAQILHHEANGHGFAKLDDEYAYETAGAIPEGIVTQSINIRDLYGWSKNIDFINDPAQVRWAKFLADTRYQNEGLGVFEGGLTYWTGVWRATENSIMKDNTGGFNAPSREAIYYRIHKLAYGADWQYDYEKFVEWDAINRKSAAQTKSMPLVLEPQKDFVPLHPPVVVPHSWNKNK